MQFLTLLTIQVPGQVSIERERLDQLLDSAVRKIQEYCRSSQAYQKQLDEKLVRLPDQIGKGINPEAIASRINESLRQEFLSSTLPETAKALSLVSEEMKESAGEFDRTADSLTNSYRSAAERARDAISGIQSAISGATTEAKRAIAALDRTFNRALWWIIGLVFFFALAIGFSFGMLFEQSRERFAPPVMDIPQDAPPIPQPMTHRKKH
jgi:Fe2+ transport system protein B